MGGRQGTTPPRESEKSPSPHVCEGSSENRSGAEGGVNAFFGDYRNQGIPVNYALQYVRDEINGKSPAELNADLLLERKCIADPKACAEVKPDSLKP